MPTIDVWGTPNATSVTYDHSPPLQPVLWNYVLLEPI